MSKIILDITPELSKLLPQLKIIHTLPRKKKKEAKKYIVDRINKSIQYTIDNNLMNEKI